MTATNQDSPALLDCEAAVRALYDYLDGRLPDASERAVKHHVEVCQVCASHFQFARRVLDLVPESMPLGGEANGLRARIVASLQAEGYRGASS